MELGTITRELHIQATPDVVYHVITSPEHLREWWPDDVDLEPTAGAQGFVTFGEPGAPDTVVAPITVVEADPPRKFAFRWLEDDPGSATSKSLLVTFDLEAVDGGTLLRFSETGFREKGWEAAVLEEAYADHARGWDHFLPRLVAHAATVGARP